MNNEIERNMEAIGAALNEDLCTEIIWSAMIALKKNPELTIEEAIDCGFGEWIK